MTNSDRLREALADLHSAFGLLSRLPLPAFTTPPRGGATAWAWPLVGATIGAIAALVAGAALWLGLPAGVAAGLALATQAMATGAMHEDGLADTADGLWGGWDKARRLAIMKDSHIGSYGVMALLLTTLMRWSALTLLLAQGPALAALIATGALSRVPMAALMALLPNARGTGLAQSVGRPTSGIVWRAAALGLGIALLLTGVTALAMAGAAASLCLGLALLAKAKIGGQTGDILGAAQQLAELACLSTLAARL